MYRGTPPARSRKLFLDAPTQGSYRDRVYKRENKLVTIWVRVIVLIAYLSSSAPALGI
jgi:hypothetical protein